VSLGAAIDAAATAARARWRCATASAQTVSPSQTTRRAPRCGATSSAPCTPMTPGHVREAVRAWSHPTSPGPRPPASPQSLGQRYLGIDPNPAYHDIAIRRLDQPCSHRAGWWCPAAVQRQARQARGGEDILHGVSTHPDPGPYADDPQAPLTVPYSDVIAARNAVSSLVSALTDVLDPPSEYRKDRIRRNLAAGVAPEGSGEFDSFDAALDSLRDLKHRMASYLPDRTQPPTSPGAAE